MAPEPDQAPLRSLAAGSRIHMIGVAGAGMSALAAVLLARGFRLSGSDQQSSTQTDRLAAQGLAFHKGHDPAHVDGADLVVISSAVRESNVEYAAAQALGIPIVKRAAALGWLLEGLRTIAVAGTHGKTTTSSMLAVILDRAGWDPTFVIGGEVLDLDASACFGTGAWAVVEADEYDRSFLQLRPDIAVITNVEPDHLEYYGSVEAMREAYQQFVARIVPGGTLVVNAGDPYLRSLEAPAGINLVGCSLTDPSAEAGGAAGPSVSAGSGGGQTQRSVPTAIDAYDDPIESESATWRATAGHEDGEGSAFRISGPEGVTLVRLPVSGRHNMLNAVEAIAAVAAAGIEPAVAASALSAFRGARRRFQLVGEAANVLVIDDYAHHPTEIRATLAAARARFSGRRIVVVFQPHTYSRTKLLFDDFVSAFDDADLVVLTDIYGARETDTLGMSTGLLAGALTSRLDSRRVLQTGDLAGVAGLLAPKLCAADVVLTLGAGTVTEVGPRLIEMLHGRGAGGPQDE